MTVEIPPQNPIALLQKKKKDTRVPSAVAGCLVSTSIQCDRHRINNM